MAGVRFTGIDTVPVNLLLFVRHGCREGGVDQTSRGMLASHAQSSCVYLFVSVVFTLITSLNKCPCYIISDGNADMLIVIKGEYNVESTIVYSVLGYRFYHFSLFFIRNAHTCQNARILFFIFNEYQNLWRLRERFKLFFILVYECSLGPKVLIMITEILRKKCWKENLGTYYNITTSIRYRCTLPAYIRFKGVYYMHISEFPRTVNFLI